MKWTASSSPPVSMQASLECSRAPYPCTGAISARCWRRGRRTRAHCVLLQQWVPEPLPARCTRTQTPSIFSISSRNQQNISQQSSPKYGQPAPTPSNRPLNQKPRGGMTVLKTASDSGAFQAECTPGYYNGGGTRTITGASFSPGPVAFHRSFVNGGRAI